MRTVSNVLLYVEALLLAVVTLFALIMAMNVLGAALNGKMESADIPLALMFLSMVGFLIVGWYMLSKRLLFGPLALRRISRLWWVAASLGALLAGVGFGLLANSQSRFAMFSMAIYGVPTFAHLALETWVWPPSAIAK